MCGGDLAHEDEVRTIANQCRKPIAGARRSRLDPQDVGKIIGRQGMTINAIRSLLLAGSAKKGMRCTVEIVEDRA